MEEHKNSISLNLQGVSNKVYKVYKVYKCNLKFITLINNMQLYLDFTKSNLNFEPSFLGIHQVLREIWLFEHKLQGRNFGQL